MSLKHIRGAPASKMPLDIKHTCGSRQHCPACRWLASWRVESVRWRVYQRDVYAEPGTPFATFTSLRRARIYKLTTNAEIITRVVHYTRRNPR